MKRIPVKGKMDIDNGGIIGHGVSKCVYLAKNGRLYAYMEVSITDCYDLRMRDINQKAWYVKNLGRCWIISDLQSLKKIKAYEDNICWTGHVQKLRWDYGE